MEGPCMIMPPWARGLRRSVDDLCEFGLLVETVKGESDE